jgi:CheY-like chemotaxis protein
MKVLSPCFFPTRVLLVDDHRQTLDTLQRTLDGARATYKAFASANEALPYIQEFLKTMDQWHLQLEKYIAEDSLSQLYREIYSPQRFTMISTVVVDYDMPGMNGLEFCQEIDSPYIQKILLTGAADEELAIHAFNKGLIHRFIRKQDPDALSLLDSYIAESQHSYFLALAQPIIKAVNKEVATSVLMDPAFINFFEQILKEKEICEYYLLEPMGSFLLLTETGEMNILVTMTADFLEQMEEIIDLSLKKNTESLPPQLIDDLKKRKKVLCFHYLEGLKLPVPSDWHRYAYPVQHVQGQHEYYCAYVPSVSHYSKVNTVSFREFKEA